jgi:hypothetical protein
VQVDNLDMLISFVNALLVHSYFSLYLTLSHLPPSECVISFSAHHISSHDWFVFPFHILLLTHLPAVTILILEHATILRSHQLPVEKALKQAYSALMQSEILTQIREWLAASSQSYTTDQLLEFIINARFCLSIYLSQL